MNLTQSLPVITCDGCGACCRHVGVPVGYRLLITFPDPPEHPEDLARWQALQGSEDAQRVRDMPAVLREGLANYYAAVDRGEIEDRADAIVPCLWLDAETGKCSHYEWRPTVCRDFVMGSRSCLAIREGEGFSNEPLPGSMP